MFTSCSLCLKEGSEKHAEVRDPAAKRMKGRHGLQVSGTWAWHLKVFVKMAVESPFLPLYYISYKAMRGSLCSEYLPSFLFTKFINVLWTRMNPENVSGPSLTKYSWSWGDERSLCTVWKDHEECLSWERQHVSVVSTPRRQRQERPVNQWANQLSWIGELQIQGETLSRKTRWRETEEEPCFMCPSVTAILLTVYCWCISPGPAGSSVWRNLASVFCALPCWH